jgi:hypothetical protein
LSPSLPPRYKTDIKLYSPLAQSPFVKGGREDFTL